MFGASFPWSKNFAYFSTENRIPYSYVSDVYQNTFFDIERSLLLLFQELFQQLISQSAGALEYTDCISAER